MERISREESRNFVSFRPQCSWISWDLVEGGEARQAGEFGTSSETVSSQNRYSKEKCCGFSRKLEARTRIYEGRLTALMARINFHVPTAPELIDSEVASCTVKIWLGNDSGKYLGSFVIIPCRCSYRDGTADLSC